MKTKHICAVIAAFLLSTASLHAWDLKDLKNVLGGSGSSDSPIGNIISGLLQKESLTVEDLCGTWSYSAPAVTFKSENLLQKAGGAAASSAIVCKLEPYYKTTGLDQVVMTVNPDSTFTMTVRSIILKGTVETLAEEGSEANFTFNFTALGKIKLGKMNAYVTQSGNSTNVMFDVTKLIEIAEKVSSVAKSSTITTAVNLLKSYDGVCVGFELEKTADPETK
ncbi:MAG: DUF4923 family protein [Clostridium sp.]|nr:DUF4923 family protein [Clostridium sp.]